MKEIRLFYVFMCCVLWITGWLGLGQVCAACCVLQSRQPVPAGLRRLKSKENNRGEIEWLRGTKKKLKLSNKKCIKNNNVLQFNLGPKRGTNYLDLRTVPMDPKEAPVNVYWGEEIASKPRLPCFDFLMVTLRTFTPKIIQSLEIRHQKLSDKARAYLQPQNRCESFMRQPTRDSPGTIRSLQRIHIPEKLLVHFKIFATLHKSFTSITGSAFSVVY